MIEPHILFSDDFLLSHSIYSMLFLIERSFCFFNCLIILFISFELKFIFFNKSCVTALYVNLSIFAIVHKCFAHVSSTLSVMMSSIFVSVIDKSSLRRIRACKI